MHHTPFPCDRTLEKIMFTKEHLKSQLMEMGILPTDTVLIHTSMKAVGDVENGADGLIDAFCEYLSDGLFLIPTHTWSVVNRKQPVYDVRSTVPNIGVVPRVAAFRKDGIRSLHVTHSMWAHGRNAEDFVKGEELAQTPCPIGFAWSRLADVHAKILLLGVTHARNTFIHAVDELAHIDNRISEEPFDAVIIDYDGNEHRHPFHTHSRPLGEPTSEFFTIFDQPLMETGAQRMGRLGNAEVRIIDACKCQEVLMRIYSRTKDYNQLLHFIDIPKDMYQE